MASVLVLMLVVMASIQVTSFGFRHRHEQILVHGKSIVLNRTRFPGAKCGYAKDDVFDSIVPEVAFTDPRAHAKDFSVGRGIASKMIRISRAILNVRAIALELTGDQAERLIYAQYGITYATVPRGCFKELREAVSNDGKSWNEAKASRKALREILQRMPTECSKNSSAPETVLGRTASKKLDVLYHGCWTSYEPLMDANLSVIGVRSIDELRYKRRGTGDRLRQIWHFAKLHLLVHTDVAVRAEMLAAESATEKRRLQNQMWSMIHLQGLRDARLEFLEIDGLHNCISAQPHEVENLIASVQGRSGQFRVTVMYRERSWQAFTKAPLSFLTHPLYSLRKWGRRTVDEWHRTGTGHRIAMVLKPVVTAATLAGVVIGVMTGGASGLGLVIANAIIAHGTAIILAASASEGILDYILVKAMWQPLEFVSAAVSSEGICAFYQNRRLQSMFKSFDDSDILADARFKLNKEVESLMENNDVVEMLREYDAEHSDGHIIEEEVRRYLTGLVMGSFVDEVGPWVRQVLDQHTALDDPNFGWLNWKEWKRFREGDNSKVLKNLRVRGEGIDGVSRVQEIHLRHGGKHKVTLVQERLPMLSLLPKKVQHMTLTREKKHHIFVEDVVAYKRLRSGWLLWHDWVEYRRGKNGRSLRGKMIQFDRGLQGCDEEVQPRQACLSRNDSAAFVTKTSWKPFGRSRFIFTDQACANGFQLTSSVKMCLRIHDPEAHQRFVFDSPRRQAEEAWLKGDLVSHSISTSLSSVGVFRADVAMPINGSSAVEQVKHALHCAQQRSPQADFADIADQVLRSLLGAGSVGLEMDDPAGMGSDEDHAALAKDIAEHVGPELHVEEQEIIEILRQAQEGYQDQWVFPQSFCD